MNVEHIARVAIELNINAKQVAATALLLEEGGTVPFIARYRKEMTGSLDEVAITDIRHRLAQLAELDERRAAILKSLGDRGLLTDELKKQIEGAQTLATLEDIYLPFRPKRRTRAMIAKEKGLEPLALLLIEQLDATDPALEAAKYIDAEKGAKDEVEALSGARDIIAEMINEDKDTREAMRRLFAVEGVMSSRVIKGKEAEAAKFRDYFEWQEPVAKAPSHRVLAMFRGEKEEFLRLSVRPPDEHAIELLEKKHIKAKNKSAEEVRLALGDSYARLLSLSMETEARMDARERASRDAISVFAANLRELLMAPPLGEKAVLGIDPGFRTGCKVVCLDRQGKLLYNTAIYPTQSEHQKAEAATVLMALCDRFKIEAIAIGNGTAGRETESFVRGLGLPSRIPIVMVNESGASIYSASEIARAEFPDHDVTVRGSVSIARRLMDPLAELVKIDPKSIGVGQYQHDVDQTKLKTSLDETVVSSVNAVGVELNTASSALLSYVSGLGAVLAKNIEEYRNQNGAFASRAAIKKVPRLGPKAFEQAAGFLRIRGAKNPLDESAVHPERYALVEKMAKDLGCKVQDLMQNDELRKKIDMRKYVSDEVGMPTLTDILLELAKPGRDPRATFEAVTFAEGITAIDHLKAGMKLTGVVTNVTNFGAFVDIGVHQDGLVHVSELSDEFVKNPLDAVRVHQKVEVTVISVDLERKRIALTMKTGTRDRGLGTRDQGQGMRDQGQGTRDKGQKSQKPKGALAHALMAALGQK